MVFLDSACLPDFVQVCMLEAQINILFYVKLMCFGVWLFFLLVGLRLYLLERKERSP